MSIPVAGDRINPDICDHRCCSHGDQKSDLAKPLAPFYIAAQLEGPMLTNYIQQAMHHAHYELMENGRFFASIAPCPGLWAEGATLEACRDELQSTLEDWIMIKLRHGDRFEVIDDVDLNPRPEYAEAHQTA